MEVILFHIKYMAPIRHIYPHQLCFLLMPSIRTSWKPFHVPPAGHTLSTGKCCFSVNHIFPGLDLVTLLSSTCLYTLSVHSFGNNHTVVKEGQKQPTLSHHCILTGQKSLTTQKLLCLHSYFPSCLSSILSGTHMSSLKFYMLPEDEELEEKENNSHFEKTCWAWHGSQAEQSKVSVGWPWLLVQREPILHILGLSACPSPWWQSLIRRQLWGSHASLRVFRIPLQRKVPVFSKMSSLALFLLHTWPVLWNL